MTTLAELENRYGVELEEHITRDLAVPVISRLACQGDVAIIRSDDLPAAETPIPRSGAPVVRGDNGGNTHSLHGHGCFDRREQGLAVGVLTVPEGGEVYLLHPEHGGFAIGPGTYELRRQREQADEERLVAD